MKKCSNCGKEYEIGMFDLVSNLCEECYVKINYYTPDYDYSKGFKKREFQLLDGQYSLFDLLQIFMDWEKKVHDEIRALCIDSKKHIFVVFREFDIGDKLKELMMSRCIEIEYSFFFTDALLDTVPSFADRNKYRSVMFI